MSSKRICGFLFFILLAPMVYSQMTISAYFLSRGKEFEKYYSVQVSALEYARWMAVYEDLGMDINTQLDSTIEASINRIVVGEYIFQDISKRLFSSSLETVIASIVREQRSTDSRVRSHYNYYLSENNSIIDNSVLLVPYERAIFDVLYQLSAMEKRGSSDAAAVVYTLALTDFEKNGGNRHWFRSITRKDYDELREDSLHNLIEIDTHLRIKSVFDILNDFYPLINNPKYEPAYSLIEYAQEYFRNVNNRNDWSSEWKWVWDLLE